jgi:hypothetical protein
VALMWGDVGNPRLPIEWSSFRFLVELFRRHVLMQLAQFVLTQVMFSLSYTLTL